MQEKQPIGLTNNLEQPLLLENTFHELTQCVRIRKIELDLMLKLLHGDSVFDLNGSFS